MLLRLIQTLSLQRFEQNETLDLSTKLTQRRQTPDIKVDEDANANGNAAESALVKEQEKIVTKVIIGL